MRGEGVLRFARAWFDEGTVTRVFEPLVADWQREWIDTSGAKRIMIAVLPACVIAGRVGWHRRRLLATTLVAAGTARIRRLGFMSSPCGGGSDGSR